MGNGISQLRDPILCMLPGGGSKYKPDQVTVVRQGQLSILMCISWCYFGYKYLPFSVKSLPTAGDRVVFTLQWQLPALLMMLAGVQKVANMRWRTKAINPLTPCEEERVFQINGNYLSNTTEQFILNSSAKLILCTYLNQEQMKMIPLLSALFVLGRLTFWKGYLYKETYRGFGFCTTFFPTLVTIGACTYYMVKNSGLLF